MGDFFYWMGVIFSGLFLLIGLFIFIGMMTDYYWNKMKNVLTLVKIMNVYNDHK